MNKTSERKANQSQRNTRSKTPHVKDASWHRADEQLDDALRQTFPASDALSIVQSACRD
jgi:hypothetical protein